MRNGSKSIHSELGVGVGHTILIRDVSVLGKSDYRRAVGAHSCGIMDGSGINRNAGRMHNTNACLWLQIRILSSMRPIILQFAFQRSDPTGSGPATHNNNETHKKRTSYTAYIFEHGAQVSECGDAAWARQVLSSNNARHFRPECAESNGRMNEICSIPRMHAKLRSRRENANSNTHFIRNARS